MTAPRVAAWLSLLALGGSSGCTSFADTSGVASLNRCAVDSDCARGVCANDGTQSLCVATEAELEHLYLELDVANNSPVAAGTRTVLPASAFGLDLQGGAPNGFLRGITLPVAEPVEVVATLEVSPLAASCAPILTGKTLRASLELHPVGQPIGVSLPPYTGAFEDALGGPRVAVPRGTYDIYIKPEIAGAPECTLPPVLIKEQLIDHYTELHYVRGEPTTLVGHLDVPHPPECEVDPSRCFRIELLDNQRGRVIGSTARLEAEGALATEGFTIRYWSDDKGSAPLDPVLVLRPPSALKELGMPELFWKLAAIDPDGDHDVSLELATLTSATSRYIPLEATVRAPNGDPVSANVLLSSRQLLGGTFGDNALFQTAVTTDAEGNFAANILPGKYDVVAIPSANSTHAITLESWTFGQEDLGKGRTFEVKPVSRVLGTALSPTGFAVANIASQVTPSATDDVSFLEAAFAAGQSAILASLPRTAMSYTDSNGAFELPLDPGRVDLSLRPSSATNLPWLVRRSVSVSSSEPQILELGNLAFTEPVVLLGTVVTPDGAPMPGATVRAWLATPSENSGRPSALGIGQATSDANGQLRLLLPSSVVD